jgi:hypothetical protein
MTCRGMARTGPVPALMPGTTELGRGERETRGEHRGRGERLTSVSRFVFSVPVVLLLTFFLPAAAQAQLPQEEAVAEGGRYTIGLRLGGVVGTRLIADDIGASIIPDTLIDENFERDSISVTMGVAPDLTLVAGYGLDEETTLQLAVGYSFGNLSITQAGASQDGGSLAVGHALVAVQKPVRGFLGRVGAGVLWFNGGDITVVEHMRTINPLLELGVARRWPWAGFDLDVGLAGQATQLTSEAVSSRGGEPGFMYRLGVELGLSRRLDR